MSRNSKYYDEQNVKGQVKVEYVYILYVQQ